MSERARKRQGRPSRGTPTPPGYGYLAHHLPRKVTHARISGSVIEQVLNARVENDFRAFDYIDNRILQTSESARKRQGRPSRGTHTPPGYGYLTHHLPQKVTLTRISDSATDEQVLILETRGKETQLYNTTIRCLGLSVRKKHTRASDKLFLQVQTSAGGGAAPSASFPPLAESGPASDGDTGGRISTSKENASTALGPSRPGSLQGPRPERTPRLAAP
jgi:hypothetical protein